MNPQSISDIKAITKKLNAADSKQFLKKVLNQTSAEAITNLLHNTYGDLFKETIYE